jgi:hypothetical protein
MDLMFNGLPRTVVKRKINQILKSIPRTSEILTHFIDAVPTICLKCSLLYTGSPRSHAYKDELSRLEYWVDGYQVASGRRSIIVSGCIIMSLEPMKPKQSMIIFIVEDVDRFTEDLSNLVTVVSVQES